MKPSEIMAPRRVVTAPPSLPLPTSSQPDGIVETLYDHPSVKIVSFTAGSYVFLPLTSAGVAPSTDVEPGSLAWTSQLERTIAVGHFRIYCAHGSVAFLSCGTHCLQPILPKSQAWCVDEQSTMFVLQVRRAHYWRIELPSNNPDGATRAQLLRDVFGKILQFEKTPCPFKRTFHVPIPERPAPVKKRPWTPVQASRPSLRASPETPKTCHEALSRDGAITTPAQFRGEQQPPRDGPQTVALRGTDEHEDDVDVTVSCICQAVCDHKQLSEATYPIDTTGGAGSSATDLTEPRRSRSGSALPPLRLGVPPSAQPEGDETASKVPGLFSRSRDSSQASFHSMQSWHSPVTSLPPSPPLSGPNTPRTFPFPHQNIPLPKDASNPRDGAEKTVTPGTPQTWLAVSPGGNCTDCVVFSVSDPGSGLESTDDGSHLCSSLDRSGRKKGSSTGASAHSGTQATFCGRLDTYLSPTSALKHRATTSNSIPSSRRALSPLPRASIVLTPRQLLSTPTASSSSKLAVVKRLPLTVMHKTCEILLSPPSHLLNLMLNVAARIKAGEWRGFTLGTSESGEAIPVRWDWTDEEDNDRNDGQRESDDWGTDDVDSWHPLTARMAGSFPDSDCDDDVVASPTDTVRRRRTSSPVMTKAWRTDGAGPASPDIDQDEWSRVWGVD